MSNFTMHEIEIIIQIFKKLVAAKTKAKFIIVETSRAKVKKRSSVGGIYIYIYTAMPIVLIVRLSFK